MYTVAHPIFRGMLRSISFVAARNKVLIEEKYLPFIFYYICNYTAIAHYMRTCGSTADALCYKPEGHGFDFQ
jgi:hypothetical protein